ncbi:MAG TPA: hypothetical protein DEB10_01360 [Ruminococcaceae bacterium]|nr:hypothetical protein [Oscillospiraceae bacterium]
MQLNNITKIKMTIKNNSVLSKNITGTVFLRGIALLISFFSTPAYLDFFPQQEVLGIWFTILSILNWILTFDFGIGNGLRNNLVRPLIKKDFLEVKRQISSAYIILGLISLIVLLFGWFLIGIIDWNLALNISSIALSNKTLMNVIRIVYCGIIVQFFLKIIVSVHNAMQKNILANLFSLVSNSIILCFLFFGKSNSLIVNLYNLSYVYTFSITFPLIVSTIYTFAKHLKYSKPNIHYYDKKAAKSIVTLGGTFFIIQLGLLVVNSTNQWLINALYQSENVVDYQVYYKLFSIAPMVFFLFTQPIWSATTEAYERGEINWIRKSYKFLNFIASLGSFSCFCVILFLQPIFNVWLGKNSMEVSTSTALIFASLVSFEMFMYSATCIANGIGKLRCQFICTMVAALLKIPVTLLLTRLLGFWECVVIAHTISILPIIIFQFISLKKHLKT